MSNGRTYEWNGEQLYLTEICRRVGANYSTVKTRILEGMSVREALSVPKKRNTYHVYDIEYEGRHWTAQSLSIHLGIPLSYLYDVLRRTKNSETATYEWDYRPQLDNKKEIRGEKDVQDQ